MCVCVCVCVEHFGKLDTLASVEKLIVREKKTKNSEVKTWGMFFEESVASFFV